MFQSLNRITLDVPQPVWRPQRIDLPSRDMQPRSLSLSTSQQFPLEQIGTDKGVLEQDRSLTSDTPPEIDEDAAVYEATQNVSAPVDQHVFERIPDGGYGWIVVGSCFICM